METKICNSCKNEYPKTLEYFLLKPKRKNYKWKVYEIYREKCKKCWYEESKERRILKKCKEVGIERKDWENWKRQELLKRPIFQLKDERLKELKRPLRARILRKIREENYIFTTIEDYYIECNKNKSVVQRKYDYKDKSKIDDNVIKEFMPDYYIANRLKKPLNELPKEVIETKRLIIKLKRELKNK